MLCHNSSNKHHEGKFFLVTGIKSALPHIPALRFVFALQLSYVTALMSCLKNPRISHITTTESLFKIAPPQIHFTSAPPVSKSCPEPIRTVYNAPPALPNPHHDRLPSSYRPHDYRPLHRHPNQLHPVPLRRDPIPHPRLLHQLHLLPPEAESQEGEMAGAA